jgi:hypothetical protein
VGTERLEEALTAVERVAGLSKTLLGRIKGAFARACVAYAEGHIEIASHELMTLDLWLEHAFDKLGDAVDVAGSPLWQADSAAIRLRRDWRKEWKRRQWAAVRERDIR